MKNINLKDLVIYGGLGWLAYTFFSARTQKEVTAPASDYSYQATITPVTPKTLIPEAVAANKELTGEAPRVATPIENIEVKESSGGSTSSLKYTIVNIPSDTGKALKGTSAVSSGQAISTQAGVVTTMSKGFAALAKSRGLA